MQRGVRQRSRDRSKRVMVIVWYPEDSDPFLTRFTVAGTGPPTDQLPIIVGRWVVETDLAIVNCSRFEFEQVLDDASINSHADFSI